MWARAGAGREHVDACVQWEVRCPFWVWNFGLNFLSNRKCVLDSFWTTVLFGIFATKQDPIWIYFGFSTFYWKFDIQIIMLLLGIPPCEGGETRRSVEGHLVHWPSDHFPFLFGDNRHDDQSQEPKVRGTDQGHVPEGDDENLRDEADGSEQWTMKPKHYEACRRFLPKVAMYHEICDPGRSVQVELSYSGKLPNTPDVIS